MPGKADPHSYFSYQSQRYHHRLNGGEYVEEIVKILSDTELNYTEVIEMWFIRYGICGHREHFYALVRMEKRRAESVLRRIK